MRTSGWAATLCGSMILASCMGHPRQAVYYSGSEYRALTTAFDLETVSSLPVGYEVIGTLQASCQPWEAGSAVRGLWLSDLDCTVDRLQAVLREKAAEVGGKLLVRPRCGSRGRRAAGALSKSGARRMTCRGEVARPNLETRGNSALREVADVSPAQLAAGPAQAYRLDDPTLGQAWRIRVHYQPGADASKLKPLQGLDPADVSELTDLPASHLVLGSVKTKCRAGCSEDAMRASLRVVAARLGATDVVGVRCLSSNPGWHCTGTLALPVVRSQSRLLHSDTGRAWR